MERKLKKEYGITLVALVITIIILLILAGISIQALIQTNLFNQAKLAKNATENAQKEENKILSEYMDKVNEYLPETLAYKVNSGEIPIGSYIKYTPDTVGEETINNLITELGTYSGSEDNTKETLKQEMELNWRVLDVKDGQVRLISDVPTTSKIELKGYNGYNNSVKLIDEICNKLYNNSKLTNKAQNLKIEDIQDKMKESDYTNFNTNYGKIITMTNKYYTNILLKEKEQEANIGDTVIKGIELGLSEQNEYIKQEKANKADVLKVKYTYYYKEVAKEDFDNSKYYEIFINNGNENLEYWLSSRCIGTYSEEVRFNIRRIGTGNIGANYTYDSSGVDAPLKYSLRPIIILNSNVQVDTTKPADGTQPSTAYEVK